MSSMTPLLSLARYKSYLGASATPRCGNTSSSASDHFTLKPRFLSTEPATESLSPTGYAIVRHAEAYEKAMEGLHGDTLEKAKLVGQGRDDRAGFDPFLADELMEEELLAKHMSESASLEDEEDQGTEGDEGSDAIEEEIQDTETAEPMEDDPANNIYNKNGSIRRTNAQRAILAAGAPAGGMFAVIELAGTQFKVTDDDVLIVHKLIPVKKYSVGSVHTFKNVMFVGTSHYSLVGLPYVEGAEVDVMVEEITKGEKVVIFKRRRRKHSQRRKGFRRDVTVLRILEVRPPPEFQEDKYVQRIEPELKPLPEIDEEDFDDDFDGEEEETA